MAMKITFVELRNLDALGSQTDIEKRFCHGMVNRIQRMNFYPRNFDVQEYLAKYLFRTGGWVQALSPHLDGFSQEVVWYTGKEDIKDVLNDGEQLILLSVGEAVAYPVAQQFVYECRLHFPKHPIWVGGLYTSIYPEIVSRDLQPDLVFVGEADSDIGGLAKAHANGQKVPDRVTMHYCPVKELRQDWALSFQYSAPPTNRTPFVLTSRDCPFDYAFCSIIKKGVMRQWVKMTLVDTKVEVKY
jgi:hypothetical protein